MSKENEISDKQQNGNDFIADVTCCIATEHAYEKAKERLGWKRKVLDKMMVKAFDEGIKHSDTKGSLNKYITKLWFKYRTANNIRIYGENVYFFCGETLITLYRLDNKMIKHLQYYR